MVIQLRPIFFTLLFLLSFSFAQEMTQEEMAAVMQEEMACADEKPGKGTVVDSNSRTPLAGAKCLLSLMVMVN